MNPTHVVESGYLSEGLFGQVLIWCLEVLPWMDRRKIRPEWRVLSRQYGTPPEFNIFPDVVELNYEPTLHAGPSEVLSLEELKGRVGHPNFSFQTDFVLANRLFHKYFRVPTEVLAGVEGFLRPYSGHRILGLHYRGTDKIADRLQTNPMSVDLLLRAARDLLTKRSDISLIFLATDEATFVEQATHELPLPCLSYRQHRSAGGNEPPFRGHAVDENTTIARSALVDSLLLSRCACVLKCQSALSGWSRIWNPGLEAYRVAAFKTDWFPDAFVPMYGTEDPDLVADLRTVQEGEWSVAAKLESSRPVSSAMNDWDGHRREITGRGASTRAVESPTPVSASSPGHVSSVVQLPESIETLIVSYGGVGTTFLISFVAQYKRANAANDSDGFKHLPIPPSTRNRSARFVYVYGDPRLAVVSLFRRNFQHGHSRKLLRFAPDDIAPVPAGMSLKEYAAAGLDRLRLRQHFRNWYHGRDVSAPTMFLRYETLFERVDSLFEFLNIPATAVGDFPAKTTRSSCLSDLDPETQRNLDAMYGDFTTELSRLDDVEIRHSDKSC